MKIPYWPCGCPVASGRFPAAGYAYDRMAYTCYACDTRSVYMDGSRGMLAYEAALTYWLDMRDSHVRAA